MATVLARPLGPDALHLVLARSLGPRSLPVMSSPNDEEAALESRLVVGGVA
jgi:hypothetical protein